MYTRLTGQGPHASVSRCSQAAISAFSHPRKHDPAVDPGRLAASVALGHPPHAHQRVRRGNQHQFLQIADPPSPPPCVAVKILSPQPHYVILDPAPIHGIPVA